MEAVTDQVGIVNVSLASRIKDSLGRGTEKGGGSALVMGEKERREGEGEKEKEKEKLVSPHSAQLRNLPLSQLTLSSLTLSSLALSPRSSVSSHSSSPTVPSLLLSSKDKESHPKSPERSVEASHSISPPRDVRPISPRSSPSISAKAKEENFFLSLSPSPSPALSLSEQVLSYSGLEGKRKEGGEGEKEEEKREEEKREEEKREGEKREGEEREEKGEGEKREEKKEGEKGEGEKREGEEREREKREGEGESSRESAEIAKISESASINHFDPNDPSTFSLQFTLAISPPHSVPPSLPSPPHVSSRSLLPIGYISAAK